MRTYEKKAKPSVQPVAPPASQVQDPLQQVQNLSSIEHAGHRVDLPNAIQSKMENAFGADLSRVRLYESQAVADMGASALTQGSHIAFAPGQLDLVSAHGQALLGHELSHVVSQARGEARGAGLLENHSLEARADREGMMAAAGQSIYPGEGGMAAPAAAPAGMSGPVQAKRPKRGQQQEQPVAGPANSPSLIDDRPGAGDIEGDSLGGALLRAGLAATGEFNAASSMVETLASQRDDESYILGELGSRAGVLNDSDALGYANVAGSSVDALQRTVETFSDVRDTWRSDRSTSGKIMSTATDLSAYGSDLSGDLKNIVGSFVSDSSPVPDQLEQAGNSMRIIAGTGRAVQALQQGRNATSDRYGAERAGRRIQEEAAERAQSGDQAKIANDRLLRVMATGARGTAKVHKAESVQNGTNAGFDMLNGSVGFIPGYGNLAAAGGSALQKAVNVGTSAHVEQERKQAREANLANLQLRRSLEQKLGMRDDLSEKEKNAIRHRAKHLANQITTGERGATTNKVAGMHKTQGDVAALGELTAQDNGEGQRAREIVNMMGISTDYRGQLLSPDSAAAQVNADFSRGDSMDEQLTAANVHQFEKHHMVEAERKRQLARAEAKAQKKAAKQQKKDKEAAARAHFESLSPENQQRIREANKGRDKKRRQYAKEQGVKWYQRGKKKEAALEYDVEHRIGDEYGGHDVSEKQAKLDALREKRLAKETAKLDRAQRKEARKQARKDHKAYEKERTAERKKAGIHWYQFGKKKEFEDEYDYTTGTKERPDENAPEGSATAEATKSMPRRAIDYMKNKWYSMRRSHDRATRSFVEDADTFHDLPFWRRTRLVLSSPAAYISSKTQGGKDKAARMAAEEAADSQLLEQILANPDAVGADGSIGLPTNQAVSPDALLAAKAGLKPVDASQLSRNGKIQRLNTGTHAIDEVQAAREAAGEDWARAPQAPEAAESPSGSSSSKHRHKHKHRHHHHKPAQAGSAPGLTESDLLQAARAEAAPEQAGAPQAAEEAMESASASSSAKRHHHHKKRKGAKITPL